MITQFTEVLIDNLASDSVWTFFSSCLSTKMIVTCSGLTKQVSHLLLSSLASSPLLAEKVKDKQQAKLLSLLVKFCLSDTTLEARNMGFASPPSPSLLMDQFKNIWGQEAFSGGRVVGRGEFYLLYGSKDTSEEDVERWVQTCWLLEVTEKLVGQQKGKEEDWLLLARPMFVLLCKVADREVEKGSYKLSLLLSVLLQLLSLVPDSKLWQLMTGQLDPELVVHCIRTSPSGGPHLRKMFGDRLERRRLWRNLMSGMCCQMQCPSCRRSWRRMIRQLRLLAEISSNSCP